jgi:hypothetical protein
MDRGPSPSLEWVSGIRKTRRGRKTMAELLVGETWFSLEEHRYST